MEDFRVSKFEIFRFLTDNENKKVLMMGENFRKTCFAFKSITSLFVGQNNTIERRYSDQYEFRVNNGSSLLALPFYPAGKDEWRYCGVRANWLVLLSKPSPEWLRTVGIPFLCARYEESEQNKLLYLN